jgi:hypothetical protein
MEHSPSGEAISSSASQEIPHIVWKSKVQYCVHEALLLFPILSQINPLYAPNLFLEDLTPNKCLIFQKIYTLYYSACQ